MRRLAIALAVLVGGVTAVPGTALAHDLRKGPLGAPDDDCHILYGEAKRVVKHHMGDYHGGPSRFGRTLSMPRCEYGYNREPIREIGVRANDGTLLAAIVTVHKDRYYLLMLHNDGA